MTDSFFPPVRPPTETAHSDDSINTVSTDTSGSSDARSSYSSSSDSHPYARLSIIDRTGAGPLDGPTGPDPVRRTGLQGLLDYAFPGSVPSTAPANDEPEGYFGENALSSLREGTVEESFGGPTPGRHNSLPTLVAFSLPFNHHHRTLTPDHSPGVALRPAPLLTSSYDSSTAFINPRASPLPPSPYPPIARSHSFGSPSSTNYASLRSPSLPPNSFHPPPMPSRSGSSSTFSTASSTSTRPWVRDSDASSICSAGSGSCWSGGDEVADGEVLKVGADGIEFLDPRPEPSGARLSLNRDDPLQVVIKVVLPGFSLDNITVAMRRGHKVHIVADAYGENGGHFEKLISLGSDVISAAPRAEFDGTELSVYVQRRQPSSGNPPKTISSSSTAAPSPASGSPSSSTVSLSPDTAVSSDSGGRTEQPTASRSTGSRSNGKGLTGPEGAKAAAKIAREEATNRANEAAKGLPKAVRRLPFAGRSRSSSGDDEKDASRSGSSSHSPPSLSISVPPTFFPASTSGGSTSPTPIVPNSPRPKLRPSNLTLRPSDSTFFEASLHAATLHPSAAPLQDLYATAGAKEGRNGEEWTRSEEGVTPTVELGEMSFTTRV